MIGKISMLAAAICCSVTLFGAATGTTTPEGWLDNFDEALVRAKKLDRPVLMLVTGSDWCPSCIMLKNKVLSTKEFKEFAEKNVVLLFIDLPRKTRLDAELAMQNRMLAGKFNLFGLPTTVMIAPSGKETGRIVGIPEDYVGDLKKLVDKK